MEDDEASVWGTGGGGVFTLVSLKNGKCQDEIKKKKPVERQKWVKLKADDKEKEVRGKPCFSSRGENKPSCFTASI